MSSSRLYDKLRSLRPGAITYLTKEEWKQVQEEAKGQPPTLETFTPEVNPARDPLLVERQKTHGDFGDHARMTWALKHHIHSGKNWDGLSQQHKEALDMIAHKIGRIMGGNPDFKDHWDDIAGYAKLGSEACK